MNKRSKEDLKDLILGLFWVGMVVVPVVYSILHREKDEKSHAL